MKKNKLESIIDNSGLKFENEEAKKAFMKQIDEDYVNGIVNDDQQEYEKQKSSLEDKIAKLNEQFEGSNSSMKELQKQFNKINAENQTLKDRALATSIAGELDDEQFEDLMLLANAKLSKNKDLKKEDVIKDIAEKRGFGKKSKQDEQPKTIPATKYFNNSYVPEEDTKGEKPMSEAEAYKHFIEHCKG